jgi:hypothetical protein
LHNLDGKLTRFVDLEEKLDTQEEKLDTQEEKLDTQEGKTILADRLYELNSNTSLYSKFSFCAADDEAADDDFKLSYEDDDNYKVSDFISKVSQKSPYHYYNNERRLIFTNDKNQLEEEIKVREPKVISTLNGNGIGNGSRFSGRGPE